ncbi:DUF2946 domain-containing protein [Enterobacteriaceae bacterium H20N1]|uniref:DUF2946 domain-containing protein n=1 Tax=Dryocola boscaweniae TaxID=2925397 RepID=A0A9X2W4Q7_9ENTR|nr:DUF2946 domain-containing protein [Dryocola boscaweniae]MCT4700690.1 DUF2946 domain-containing protein [Dryocola boscaweniae]MCT4716164.1 DUF2946 domain-containing protein [Dryocola boscaweniae]MCT4717896.1 DUF2946 domain-containing protein [Dryocola boscaweniae]
MLQSTFWSTSRLRFFRKHLLMLLLAFGWLFVNSQVAVASHDCPIDVSAQAASVQHSEHMLMADEHPSMAKISGPLCGKHCIPDVMQKDNGHSDMAALPVSNTLALIVPDCTPAAQSVSTLTPPATGPPATIRFCRFRE